MGTPRMLVAAESRHGSTREVADAIGRRLTAAGCRVDVLTLEEVGALAPYDGVVLGSAIYLGRWLQPARRFITERADELRACTVWLFSSGPIGSPPFPDPDAAFDPTPVIEATGARGHRLFAGRLDQESLGMRERFLVRAARVHDGDFRDWAAIEAWADEIAAAAHRLVADGAPDPPPASPGGAA